jgi:hypothetical protein
LSDDLILANPSIASTTFSGVVTPGIEIGQASLCVRRRRQGERRDE